MEVKIDSAMLRTTAQQIKDRIQTDLVDVTNAECQGMLGELQNSSGSYVESLKKCIDREQKTIEQIAVMLDAIVDYVLRASDSFIHVDEAYASRNAISNK